MHEGGIATPLIAHWPAKIKKTGLRHDAAHLIDIMATCVEMAEVKYPRNYSGHPIVPLEGKSLLPVLAGKDLPERPLFWEHEGNKAIRLGKWKLVSKFRGEWELYDLAADPTELVNLATSDPGRKTQLLKRYEAWATRTDLHAWPVTNAGSKKE